VAFFPPNQEHSHGDEFAFQFLWHALGMLLFQIAFFGFNIVETRIAFMSCEEFIYFLLLPARNK
jgi:hypothetical protein